MKKSENLWTQTIAFFHLRYKNWNFLKPNFEQKTQVSSPSWRLRSNLSCCAAEIPRTYGLRFNEPNGIILNILVRRRQSQVEWYDLFRHSELLDIFATFFQLILNWNESVSIAIYLCRDLSEIFLRWNTRSITCVMFSGLCFLYVTFSFQSARFLHHLHADSHLHIYIAKFTVQMAPHI